MTYRTSAGSGVPNVGAPDCIDIEQAKVPRTTGAPGRTSWTKVIPPSASARVWAHTPAAVTGAIAPARMNGVIRVGLVGLGVGPRRAEHRRVPDQRRVGVDQAAGSTVWSSR